MRARVPSLVFLLIVGSLGVARAQDWTGKGRVQGAVLDPEGEPVEGAEVNLLRDGEEGEGPETLVTNKKGKWSYLGLRGGRWVVRITKEGYLISEGDMNVTEFSANQVVRVRLKPIPEEVLAEARGELIIAGLERGNELLAAGKPAEARAEYEAVLGDLEPTDQMTVLMGIARSYYQEDNLADTEATLLKVLELDPSQVDALKLLASMLVSAGREQEAKVYMDRLPEGEILHADAYLNVGIDLYNSGDLEAALTEFDRVVANFPDNPDAYYYRGLVLLNRGENERASADFQKLLELQPEGARADEAKQFLEYLGSGE